MNRAIRVSDKDAGLPHPPKRGRLKRQGYMLRTLILSMLVATALGMARGQIGDDRRNP
jgi:hypothetical protein